MTVLAIDPGSEQSAYVLWDGEKVQAHQKLSNEQLRRMLWSARSEMADRAVIEQVASYGMAVGAEVFATCVWTGRFMEATPETWDPELMPRKDVKLHLCGQARAKDANIRQALIDRFGGKEQAIGKKSAPGPLYGLKADEWQALALAVTFHDLHGQVRQ
jgi:S-methylmethionine-dependent homocysteine/selenocysteine methylase